jgi:hypothetical protein
MNNIRSGNLVEWTDTTANPQIIHRGTVSSGPIVCYRVEDLDNNIQLVEKMRLTVIDKHSNNNNNNSNIKKRKTRKLRR